MLIMLLSPVIMLPTRLYVIGGTSTGATGKFIFEVTASVVYWLSCSSVVDRGFERQSGQTKDFKIGIGCFSTKDAA